MLNIRKAVFFGAHTDDEMICAGTLHRLAQTGTEVHVVSFAPAATQNDRTGTAVSCDIVRPEWEKALDIIGAKHHMFCAIRPSADLQPRRQYICQVIYDYCEKYKPDVVFTLSPEDENTAHAIVGTESERVMRGRVPVVIRCQFPWNYGVGRANLFVKLEWEDRQAKLGVIEAYESQAFRYNYKEMLLSYCRADGLSVKVDYAEKFEMIRGVL